nr:alpha-amylase family glycosyl hydrolase [Actinomycetota bacterium]
GWYRWRDNRADAEGGSGPPGSHGRLPNNWRAAFAGVGGTEFPPAWTWDEATEQWYLHLFLAEQPDLDWSNPEVRAAMEDTLQFWMDRGVDGFRVDVVHALGKDPALADLPPESAIWPVSASNDHPSTHPIITELRQVVDRWPEPPPRMMVGEVYLPTTEQVATYYGTTSAPELHLSFNFPPLFAPWDAAAWRRCIDEVHRWLDPRDAWPTWVLSNHDNRRHRSRYGAPAGDPEGRARAAAVLLLTLRGTPFLYAGEELGLEDALVPLDREVDPGGRDGCRAPIPWDGNPGHGWAGGPHAWLPWPPQADDGRTAEDLRQDATSILHLYRHLLHARQASPALTHGTMTWLNAPEGVLAYKRAHDDDERVVVINFGSAPLMVQLPDGVWRTEVTSLRAGRGVATCSGQMDLAGEEACVLRLCSGADGEGLSATSLQG